MAGYGVREARGVRDPLAAQALALSWGDESAVVVSLDLLGLPRPEAEEVEVRVREAVAHLDLQVVVACTHTHVAPDLIGLWGLSPARSGVNPSDRARVLEAAVEAAMQAWAARRASTLWGAEGRVEGVAENARDPGLVDPVVTTLSWRAEDGTTLARVLHFACHPEALGPDDARLSADLAGVARRLVAAILGGPCVWWQGALGGMVTPSRLPGEVGEETLVRQGLCFGGAAVELVARERPLPGGLAVRRHAVVLPVDNAVFLEAARSGVVVREFVSDPPGARVRSSAGILRLGPYDWLLAPGEVLPALARRWVEGIVGQGRRGRVLGLCDDEIGYILPPEAFTPGRYEEGMSLGRDTATCFEAVYRALGADLG